VKTRQAKKPVTDGKHRENLILSGNLTSDLVKPIFDKEKEQQRIKEAQLIGEIGSQVSDILRTEGQIAATKAATDKMATASDGDREKAKADWEKANPGRLATADDINGQVYQNFYNAAFAETGLGTGGTIQQAVQAATAAVQGLAGGNIGQAISGAAAPYLAEQIHKLAPNEESRAMAHAVVGAVTSWAAGNSAAAGAAGAVTGELMAQLVMAQLYPGKKVSDLTETEKQTISALGTLAAGLAGGIAGDSTADAVSGAQAGQNAINNNYLSSKEARQLDTEMQDCKASGGDCNKVIEKYIDISNKNSKELIEACTEGGVACVSWQEWIQGATNVANDAHASQFRIDEKLKDPDAAALVNYLNGIDLKFLQDNITTGDKVMSVVMDPTSWPVAIMGAKAIITNSAGVKEQLLVAGISGVANAAIQYKTSPIGEVKLSDVIGSGVVGAITAGKGYNPTLTWNAVGGYYQAKINGDDPAVAGLLSTIGAGAGSIAGSIIKVPLDKMLNPISKQYEWVSTGVWTISKPVSPDPLPSILGNISDSGVSGMVQDKLKNGGTENEKK
jgi:filamentous hemagglutinin